MMKPLLLSALLVLSSSCSCSALPPPGLPAAAIDDEEGDANDEDLPRVTPMSSAVQLPTVHVLPDDDSLTFGPASARHTLTVFVDLENSAAVLVQLLARSASVRQLPTAFLDGRRVQSSSWASLETMLTAAPARW